MRDTSIEPYERVFRGVTFGTMMGIGDTGVALISGFLRFLPWWIVLHLA